MIENKDVLENFLELEGVFFKNSSDATCVKVSGLFDVSIPRLSKIASDLKIEMGYVSRKQGIILRILKELANLKVVMYSEGYLEVLADGYGFLRSSMNGYVPSSSDVYVSVSQIKRFGLRRGDKVYGEIRAPRNSEKFLALIRMTSVNDLVIDHLCARQHFDDLVPIYPNKRILLEVEDHIDMRILDLIVPIGRGQRGLIVAPPKSGKTVLLQHIANSIHKNYPDIKILVLLIDERVEEVTDMKRSVFGEVISSTFDESSERHVHVAEMVLEKAKRMVESGQHVVILLDSITRLARAYNITAPSSGRVLSGGLDSNALQRPKRFFGAARNIENGGSLTILATALIETYSRIDEVIFEEFKGTGNMEVYLDRKIFEKRVFPSIDINKSGTRKEELLLDVDVLNKVWILRKIFSSLSSIETIELLKSKIAATKTNVDFFKSMELSSAGQV